MSSLRTERLLNLVIALLATRRWLTKEQIRHAVPQYAECESTEAFDRMFERDKEDLRELGVPLETGTDSAWFDDEQGYRIDRNAYALPEVELTAEELAVLGLASRVWQQASLAGPAARALVKLRALGVETDEDSLVGVEPRIRAAEPSFDPLYAATRDRVPVSFRYRRPDGATAERHVQPWAVTSRSGWWYVVGFDRDRGETRAFKLSRIEGGVKRIGKPGSYEVPDDIDATQHVTGAPSSARDVREAWLGLRPGRGAALRLRAVPEPAAAGPGDGDRPAPPEGWDVVRVTVQDPESFAEEVASNGADVVVLGPPDVREAVVRRLRGALARQQGHLDLPGGPTRAAPAGARTRRREGVR
ncbi:MAG: WYL domain-containing protein [Actinobacteria bacterium]|nr:WYL domain-containing protein [Actinomycetota bacterium]